MGRRQETGDRSFLRDFVCFVVKKDFASKVRLIAFKSGCKQPFLT
jgi:hypothetical protein